MLGSHKRLSTKMPSNIYSRKVALNLGFLEMKLEGVGDLCRSSIYWGSIFILALIILLSFGETSLFWNETTHETQSEKFSF